MERREALFQVSSLSLGLDASQYAKVSELFYKMD
jgi:hypothetical protein